jgi:hypothetical protein
MHFTCHLRKGVVYISTLGKMEEGFYRGVEPVVSVPVSNDLELRQAFQDTIARGNPIVPRLRPGERLEPPILKYAGVKSWATFVKGTIPISAYVEDGVYRIVRKKNAPDRGWINDPDQTTTLPTGSTIDDLCTRLIEILQAKASHP